MKLVTKEIAQKIPGLYKTDGFPPERKICYLKLFNPGGSHTWYVFEGNAVLEEGKEVPLNQVDLTKVIDIRFFGYLTGVGIDNELGYFMLSEIAQVRSKWGLPIERDMHYAPESFKTIRERCG